MSQAESSLRAYDRIADRIKLHRQADDRATVVVEGPSDERFVDALLEQRAVIFVAGTRSAVIDVTEEASRRLSVTRLVGVVDRDFDDIVAGAEAAGLPMVAYDGADLEDMLLHSPAGNRLIEEMASSSKLKAYGGASKLLADARERVIAISRLRSENAREGWGLAFDSVDLRGKVDKDTLEMSVLAICAALKVTTECAIEHAQLETAARSEEAERRCPHTGTLLARGRDVLVVIGISLRRLVGSRTKDQTDPHLLAAVLRTAADLAWFRQTPWFARLAAQL
ncbi:MAG: hypothetical protein QOC78_274 [Solirubrobacteraceae bacterium]|jgi:hypothetical protein|nr:hypothetical protein [Solirubrobacteraceae bacterium]